MERVQLNLERLLPELRDLEKKKIFTRREIDEIVKRRTAFENSLIRKGSNEQDWLMYIEYEKKLELLRKIRYNKLNLKGRPTVSDYSIARHILSLYSSSVTRLPGSMKLWQSYITHVISTSNSSAEVSRVLARAIGLHPTKADIWLLAIRFEADGTPTGNAGGIGGGNIDAARKLTMRALRFMKSATKEDSIKIWLEWIRLEISFMERLRKRWEILGIKDAMSGEQNVKTVDIAADKDASDALPDPKSDLVQESREDSALAKTAGEVQDSSQEGEHAVLSGEIVKVVITNALSSSKDDIEMYDAVLQLLRTLPTPVRQDLLRHTHKTFESVQTPHLSNPSLLAKAVSIRAYSHIYDLSEPNKEGTAVIQVEVDSLEWIEAIEQGIHDFKRALSAVQQNNTARQGTTYLYEAYVDFVADMASKSKDADLGEYLRRSLIKLSRGAEIQGFSQTDLAKLQERAFQAALDSAQNFTEGDERASSGSDDEEMEEDSE
ncbi:hypothetical protein P389DRAFT_208035 [Cystobasidium minutum MCA 4210]|uniref:uncharacterized protein n=1 Tax=Cystobasidium minutum MCA 4210 TaxID=1397322 RepID=UPI0034CE91ED|eukprot:jgi/Rhomi1/208035/estExt_Genemark1.C_1_t30033